MAAILTDRTVAHQIAGRIRRLIARHDDGDVTAAARRLSRPIADVYQPERVIACGDSAAAVEFLADVVRTYDADVVWLITGANPRTASPSRVSTEARITIVEVLAELSEHLLDEARESRDSRIKEFSRGQAPSPSRGSPCRRKPSNR